MAESNLGHPIQKVLIAKRNRGISELSLWIPPITVQSTDVPALHSTD